MRLYKHHLAGLLYLVIKLYQHILTENLVCRVVKKLYKTLLICYE